MIDHEGTVAPTRGSSWGAFVLWAIVGCGAAVSPFVLGPLAVVPIAAAVGLLSVRSAVRRGWAGFPAGVGVFLLFVAFTNRQGPGLRCWQTATAAGCDEHLNPIPWLVFGALLVGIGLLLHAARVRSDA